VGGTVLPHHRPSAVYFWNALPIAPSVPGEIRPHFLAIATYPYGTNYRRLWSYPIEAEKPGCPSHLTTSSGRLHTPGGSTTMSKRSVVVLLLAGFTLSVLPAYASTSGRQNTAMALTGAALYTWLQSSGSSSPGKRNVALATTAAAGAAWYNYSRSKEEDRRLERRRLAYYQSRASRTTYSRR
jgi:hypothetical protein